MKTMLTKNNSSLQTVIDELNILVKEIENNPGTSCWTIRMALKAIIEKAHKMKAEES